MRVVVKASAALLMLSTSAACSHHARAAGGPVLTVGVSSEDLAGGRVDALPSGPLFVRVQSFAQPGGSDFGSKSHQPGFEYQITGSQLWEPENATPVRVEAGQAHFQPSVAHVHRNPGSETNLWLFFALVPSAGRTVPPVSPLAKTAFESEDIPPTGLPPGPYVENLQRLRLDPDGHTSPFERSGTQAVFVLSGVARIDTRAGSKTVAAFDGAYLAPGTHVEIAAGHEATVLLVFTMTPVGQPFEVPLATL